MRLQDLLAALLLPLAVVLAGCPTEEEVPTDDDDSAESDGRVQVVGTGFFDTVQEAIDAAPDGGTVLLGSGCYDEALVINKPLSISGNSPETTVITGGGLGSAITVDGVTDGAVTLTSFLVRVPRDEPATLRNFRITGSSDVLIHDTVVSFEPELVEDAEDDICDRLYLAGQTTNNCDQGLLGIDASQSNLIVSDTTISCIGFSSENGGTGILAQTDSTLTVTGSSIEAVGSFGIRSIDTELTIDDLSIFGVNRSPAAQDFESDGSAVFVEQGTGEVLVDGLSVDNGVFVGLWVESPTLTVSNSAFTGFNYGIYMPGDAASAAGRQLTLTNSDFLDLRNEAVLATASGTVIGNEVVIQANLPATVANQNSGIRLIGAGTTHEASNNDFVGLSDRALGFYGSNADGNVASVLAEGNTISDVHAGNGIDVQLVDEALIRGNVIDGVDHQYDSANGGSIGDGFGIDCFFVDECTLEGNVVSGAEFGEYVIVGSSFSSLDDVAREGFSRGFHIETSQGTFENPTVVDQLGYGILAIDSTLQGEGGTVADTARGPSIQDIDGNADPLPGELQYIQGGVSLWVTSQGAPTFLSWEDGVFADSASSAVFTQNTQVQLVGNEFLGAGYLDENGYFPSSAVYLSGNDPQALTGPVFVNNVVDGGEGSWGVYMSDAQDLIFQNNTVCAGSSTGLYLREADGAVVENSLIGTTDDPEVGACDELDWVRGVYISQTDPLLTESGVTLRDLEITAPSMDYGVYINGLGSHVLEDVLITHATTTGVYATMALPTGLTSDADGDGRRPYEGDCDDTMPTVGFLNATETPGDGLDNDCDGVTDDGLSGDDTDGDGYTIADGDCNDLAPSINPGATEVVGNFRDDNCDGWADFDGEYAWPEVSLSGTQILHSGDGFWLAGAQAHVLDPTSGEPNVIYNASNYGAYVGSWQWSNSPLYVPGSIDIGAETIFEEIGSHCIQVSAVDATATLTGTTLDTCHGNGVSLTSAGTATLQDVTILGPGSHGISVSAGDVVATNVVVDDPGLSGLAVLGFQSEVAITGLEVSGGSTGAALSSGTTALEDFVSSGALSSGVEVSGGTSTLVNAAITGSLGHGIHVFGGDTTLTGGVVTGSAFNGLYMSGGTADVTDATFSSNAGHGVSLTNYSTATVDGAALTDNGGYGLSCDGGVSNAVFSNVSLDLCVASGSGNGDGEFDQFNGCELEALCGPAAD